MTHPMLEETTHAEWLERLEQAFTPDAVLSAVQEFLLAWPVEKRAGLPAEWWRPERMEAPSDVLSWAMVLLRERHSGRATTLEANELLGFIASAARRVAQVLPHGARAPDAVSQRPPAPAL